MKKKKKKTKTIELTFDEYGELKNYAMALQAIVEMIIRTMDEREETDKMAYALAKLRDQMHGSDLL